MPDYAPIDHDAFVAAVRDLAARLAADPWRADLLVGVGRGGLAPAVYLSHATGLPMVSIDASTSITEFNDALVATLAERSAGGERIVLVEDINDSGRTIAALRAALDRSGAIMAAVRFAVLIDNRVSRERVDYAARTIDRTHDRRWFVFPWEALASDATLAQDAAAVPDRIG